LFFGRIHPDKGAKEAIAAARRSGHRLDMYGIVQDQGYFDTAVTPELDDQIRYHGPVGGADRARALGQARALLHLINFDEPFGLSVAEAMACGTPVIATRRGSMSELIEHGTTGFLVDNADDAIGAIDRIDELDRAVVRQRAIERFSVDRMADEYIALYRSVLHGTPVRNG
jgi:glycosyltransferase involved in cell wall biosynthesis